MVFSSPIFLFLFLPLVLVSYFLVPNRGKNLILLLFSLLFYTWGEGKMVALLLGSAAVDYIAGRIIEKGHRKIGLALSLIVNLGILLYFKYLNFALENLQHITDFFGIQNSALSQVAEVSLPIGISFFTFQTMSYTIDVYRGQVKANHNFLNFATYVCLFPQLVAGPIVRYSTIADQLKKRVISMDKLSQGAERFIIGLGKKVLIANTMATVADDVFSQNLNDLSSFYAWLGIIAYTFQIYFDFSGYSDMAIGLGKMFGFDFPENFNYPYIAKNMREFWRRWHISLSTWFRDYVYISLGGNRKGSGRTLLNLFIVFFVTGLWHGASWNFVIWGLFHGLFLILERIGLGKMLDKAPRIVGHVYTCLVVIFAWVFFRAENLADATTYLQKMLSFDRGNEALSSYLAYFHLNGQILLALIAAVLFSMPLYSIIEKHLSTRYLQWIHSSSVLALLVLSIIYLGAGTYNPFIYFKF